MEMSRWKRLKGRLKEKKIFIPLIIVLVIIVWAGIQWFISSRQAGNPEDVVEKSDKLISVDIANNFNGELELDNFIQLLDQGKVERVYHQYKKKEYGSVVLYYIKLFGEEGYYQAQASPGTGYIFMSTQGPAVMSLNDFLAGGSEKLFQRHIEFKLLATTPKVPMDNRQWIFLGVLLLIFVIGGYIVARVGGLGSGTFGKAKTQEMKKPVRFADVGGADEALEESKEVAEMIKAKWRGVKKDGK